MRAVVIGNADDLDPGFVGHRLRQHGFVFTEGHREDPAGWPGLDGVDLVVQLGSEWNVYRSETAGPVEAEAAFVRDVVGRRTPLLAICFGAQVLSHALGGSVTRTAAPEIGWVELPEDRVTDGAIARGPWMEWHDDVFTAPEGFDVLAANDVGPQLIRGGRTVATQFHPEATETMVRRWLGEGGADQVLARGGDPDALLALTRANVAVSRPAADALVDWFLDVVAGS
ncbi:MAG: gamma-glutamyl-gamma-aminobutyrate hydrolase family protein [Ilumatobacteraceae bacterium]